MLRLCIVQSIEYCLQHSFCTYVRRVLFSLYKYFYKMPEPIKGLHSSSLGRDLVIRVSDVRRFVEGKSTCSFFPLLTCAGSCPPSSHRSFRQRPGSLSAPSCLGSLSRVPSLYIPNRWPCDLCFCILDRHNNLAYTSYLRCLRSGHGKWSVAA